MADTTVGGSQDDKNTIEQLYDAYRKEAGADAAVSQDDFNKAVAAAFPDTNDVNYNASLFDFGNEEGFADKLGKSLFGDTYSYGPDEFSTKLTEIAGTDGDYSGISLKDLGIDNLDSLKTSSSSSSATTATTPTTSTTPTEPTTSQQPVSGTINLDKMVIAAAQALNSGDYSGAFSALESTFQQTFGVSPKDANGEYTAEFKALLQQTFEQNKEALTNYYKYGKGKSEGVDTSDSDFVSKLIEGKSPEDLMKILTSMAYDGLSTDDILSVTYTPPTPESDESASAPSEDETPSVAAEPTTEAPTDPAGEPFANKKELDEAVSELNELVSTNPPDAALIQEKLDSLSPAQLAQVMEQFNGLDGTNSLVKKLDSGLKSSSDREAVMGTIANKLNLAAQSTNEDVKNTAVATIARELHNGTAKSFMHTADEFVKAMINTADPNVITDVMQYANEHDIDLISDIQSDFKNKESKELIGTIASKLSASADLGNQQAVTILSRELYNAMQGRGTNEQVVSEIINNCSDATIVQVVNEYDSMQDTNSRGLTWDIRNDFSLGSEDKLVERINNALINEAQNGATPEARQNAVEAICNTLYKSMHGSGTDEETVKYLINNCPPEVMVQVAEQYESVSRSGNSLEHDIKGDFSFLSGQNKLLNTINTKVKIGEFLSTFNEALSSGNVEAMKSLLTVDNLSSLLGTNNIYSPEAMDKMNEILNSGSEAAKGFVTEFLKANPSIQQVFNTKYPTTASQLAAQSAAPSTAQSTTQSAAPTQTKADSFNSWQNDAAAKLQAGQTPSDFEMFDFDASTYSNDLADFSQELIDKYDTDNDGKWNFDEFYAMATEGIDIPAGQEDLYRGMFQYMFDTAMQFDNDNKNITAQEFATQLFAGDIDFTKYNQADGNLGNSLDGKINYVQFSGFSEDSVDSTVIAEMMQNLKSQFYNKFYKDKQ